jgi:hypothetical protein
VGINTVTPAGKLEVNGNATALSGSGVYAYNLGNAAAANYEAAGLTWSGNACYLHTLSQGTGVIRDLAIQPDGANALYVRATGAVGIATTSPADKLEVNGNLTSLPGGGFFLYNLGNAAAPNQEFLSFQCIGNIYYISAAAMGAGLTAGAFYRNGADPDVVMVVH